MLQAAVLDAMLARLPQATHDDGAWRKEEIFSASFAMVCAFWICGSLWTMLWLVVARSATSPEHAGRSTIVFWEFQLLMLLQTCADSWRTTNKMRSGKGSS